jgi:DNA invertase Pin-like site-specific DNA recombinase
MNYTNYTAAAPMGGTAPSNGSEDKTWRAAIYLRLSKEDGDREESESITNQRALILNHVDKLKNVTVVAEKVDDGWSGSNFQRPAFIEMMEEIRAGNIDCLLVKDLSRFGRNFGESGKYIEHVFPFLNVRFISVNDGIDSANKKGRSDDIVVPFLNLISDAYCRDISIKIRSQLDVKRKKGDFVGAFAVYGYKRNECNRNRLVVDKTAADVVKLIFQWKLDGQSAEAISTKLNTLGIPSPMAYKKSQGLNFSTSFALSADTKWSAVAVFRILRDETYTGTLVQGKVATPNHKVKKKFQKPTADWARVEDMHEPIVSLEDFDLVARLLERDTRISPNGEAVYPFSGMARCGLCGENMIRKTSHSNGKAYIYFVCCRRCKGARIAEAVLTDCVSAALQSHIDNIINMDRVLRFIDDLPLKQEEVQKLDGQIIAKREDMKRYESLIMSLYENMESGIITEAEYRKYKARYNALYNDAEQAINSLSREIGEILSCGGEKNRWIERFREYRDFTELTRRMVVSLVDVITVYDSKRMDILFRYRYDYKRCINFIETVSKMHSLPGSDTQREEAV